MNNTLLVLFSLINKLNAFRRICPQKIHSFSMICTACFILRNSWQFAVSLFFSIWFRANSGGSLMNFIANNVLYIIMNIFMFFIPALCRKLVKTLGQSSVCMTAHAMT